MDFQPFLSIVRNVFTLFCVTLWTNQNPYPHFLKNMLLFTWKKLMYISFCLFQFKDASIHMKKISTLKNLSIAYSLMHWYSIVCPTETPSTGYIHVIFCEKRTLMNLYNLYPFWSIVRTSSEVKFHRRTNRQRNWNY